MPCPCLPSKLPPDSSNTSARSSSQPQVLFVSRLLKVQSLFSRLLFNAVLAQVSLLETIQRRAWQLILPHIVPWCLWLSPIALPTHTPDVLPPTSNAMNPTNQTTALQCAQVGNRQHQKPASDARAVLRPSSLLLRCFVPSTFRPVHPSLFPWLSLRCVEMASPCCR
mmetsp:Transcript_8529/g.17012  ORF Transcript_8529/g.17012 Transcript_8529/m.17012 type:complete len:167 (+) Transcript_8529:125-625(+)